MIIIGVSCGSSQLHIYRDEYDNIVLSIDEDGVDIDSCFIFENTSDAVYFADQLKNLAQQIATEEAKSPKNE